MRTLFSRNRCFTLSSLCVTALLSAAVFMTGCNASDAGSGTATLNEDGTQSVRMQLQQSAYEPITVQKGVPVKWTVSADQGVLTNCNSEIVIPSLGVTKKLAPGDTLIEFKPKEAGSLTYTCWMGMISSTITVVDDLKN